MKRKGFTLIELLVVIAIIGLLLSVIIPSIRAAKEFAASAACLSNQKQLCIAWTAYHTDNDGWIVGGSNYPEASRANATPYRWVEYPLYDGQVGRDVENGGAHPTGTAITQKFRLNGIREGKLFPYTQDEEVYHCPADRTYVKFDPQYAAYRSYSITGLMNGEDFVNRENGLYSLIKTYRSVAGKTFYCVEKFGQIRNPGSKYVYVEEGYGGAQEYNLGSFVLVNSTWDSWWDVPALFHNRQSTLGFADTHAEIRKWQDEDTIRLIKVKTQQAVNEWGVTNVQPNNEDLQWMLRGYFPK